MRTRSRSRFNPQFVPLTGGFTTEYNTFYQEVIDVNNGKARPESPCDMVKCWTNPQEGGVLSKDGSRRYIHAPAYYQARVFRDVARQKFTDFGKDINNHILQKQLGLSKRFSSINFFLELGDVSSLIKGLDRYRYIDYQFGIAPMVDDIKNISDRMSSSISAINSRLDAYAKPTPLSYTRSYVVGGSIPIGAYPYTDTFIDFQMDIRCAFHGTITVELPLLSRYNRDYTIWLDQIGFHPDLATVWEATPFSWLVDWFLPIGSNLERMSSSWLNPNTVFTGSSHCTYNVTSTHTVKQGSTISFDNRDSVIGEHVDSSVATGYIRNPLSATSFTAKRSKITLGLGLDSLGKTALLSDIFGPTKAPEYTSLTKRNYRSAYDKLRVKLGKVPKVYKK